MPFFSFNANSSKIEILAYWTLVLQNYIYIQGLQNTYPRAWKEGIESAQCIDKNSSLEADSPM